MLNVNTWQNPSFDTDSLSQTFSILISRDHSFLRKISPNHAG